MRTGARWDLNAVRAVELLQEPAERFNRGLHFIRCHNADLADDSRFAARHNVGWSNNAGLAQRPIGDVRRCDFNGLGIVCAVGLYSADCVVRVHAVGHVG